jgi:hypothetical protein
MLILHEIIEVSANTSVEMSDMLMDSKIIELLQLPGITGKEQNLLSILK